MPAGQPRAPGDDRHVLMRIENTFDVPASADESWRLLNDVPAMVTCMPGAELVKVVGDDAWQAKLHVKLGPIALQFIADVTRVQVDEARHRAVLAVKAREAKGRGSAEATIESSLAPADEGTRVALVTELALRGAVAQYGRGVVADVAARLTAPCTGPDNVAKGSVTGLELAGQAYFNNVPGLDRMLPGLGEGLRHLGELHVHSTASRTCTIRSPRSIARRTEYVQQRLAEPVRLRHQRPAVHARCRSSTCRRTRTTSCSCMTAARCRHAWPIAGASRFLQGVGGERHGR